MSYPGPSAVEMNEGYNIVDIGPDVSQADPYGPILWNGNCRDDCSGIPTTLYGMAIVMTSEHVRKAAQVCEHVFKPLVEEFGYRLCETRFESGGFSLRYLGSALGIEVDWHPRDPLTVWLVRLVNNDFPPRTLSVHPNSVLNYFDLEDLEAMNNYSRSVGGLQLYSLPNAENARLLVDSLGANAVDLLRGDLARLPQLERRILERAKAVAIQRYGEDRAAQLGW